jgi:hypothetical protein
VCVCVRVCVCVCVLASVVKANLFCLCVCAYSCDTNLLDRDCLIAVPQVQVVSVTSTDVWSHVEDGGYGDLWCSEQRFNNFQKVLVETQLVQFWCEDFVHVHPSSHLRVRRARVVQQ